MIRFLPFGLFVVLIGFLAVGLNLDPREVPSPLIDKPVPSFHLPTLQNPDKILDESIFKGKISLFNVWASWCVSCRYEHRLLIDLQKDNQYNFLQIIGLSYKDTNTKARAFLNRLGNPYDTIVVDADGRTGINLGVYGTPETYLIDKNGSIRYKHIGPISKEDMEQKILPAIKRVMDHD